MNSFTSIFSFEPEPTLQWRIDLRYVPTKEDFLSGERAFVFVYGAEPPRRTVWECRIHEQTLSIWAKSSVGQGWVVRPCSHQDGARHIAGKANGEVISTLKKLGAFKLAEAILDIQSSAFPRFRP